MTLDVSNGDIAVFGGGCFWCTEAIFSELRGVISVMPGYAGGATSSGSPGANPSYEAVCNGATGHAEVIRIEFDPAQISFNNLLTVFFGTHDPTTLNRQGNDVGTQYRSIIRDGFLLAQAGGHLCSRGEEYLLPARNSGPRGSRE